MSGQTPHSRFDQPGPLMVVGRILAIGRHNVRSIEVRAVGNQGIKVGRIGHRQRIGPATIDADDQDVLRVGCDGGSRSQEQE